MKILLVDDDADDAAALAGTLHAFGHVVVLCRDGRDALERCAQQHYDLVIAEAQAPEIGGFVLAEKIRKLAAPRWQPVIVVSHATDAAPHVKASAAGCDAYLAKPVDGALLGARLDAIARLTRMQEEAEGQRTRISAYLAAEEADLRMARHLIEHQLASDGCCQPHDPAVQYWRRSSPRLGGDMLAVGRTPNGVLHVLLADAKECGLSAYVSLLPIVIPFQRMTEKGFPLASIVRELNAKVRQALPPERKVAAQLVTVDSREDIVGVWNGGLPPTFILDGFGHHFQEFSLCHPPLGTLDDAAFDDRIELHAFSPGEQLVMCTDGLLESTGLGGKRFGEQGLADTLVGQPRSRRLGEVVASIEAHLGGAELADDITLVLVDCEKEAGTPPPFRPHAVPAHQSGSWSFEIRLGATELGRLDVVPLLLHVVGQFQTSAEFSGKMFIVLSELFNNALDHGILRLDSCLKHAPDGMEAWLQLREERLAAPHEGEIRLAIEQFVENDRIWLRLLCQDSGPGFAVADVLAAIKARHADGRLDTLPYGRGLLLLQSIAHSVDFGAQGNCVTVLLATEDALPVAH